MSDKHIGDIAWSAGAMGCGPKAELGPLVPTSELASLLLYEGLDEELEDYPKLFKLLCAQTAFILDLSRKFGYIWLATEEEAEKGTEALAARISNDNTKMEGNGQSAAPAQDLRGKAERAAKVAADVDKEVEKEYNRRLKEFTQRNS